jgi:hypothetical protein
MKKHLLVLAVMGAAALPAVALGSTAEQGTVTAKMTGKAERPDKGAPGATGNASFTVDTDTGKICWTFTSVKGIDKPMASHIHEAGKSKAGPVVVPLGKAYKAKGCTTSKQEAGEILEHPAEYYVNIHTAKYPNGALRGQLVTGM